MLSIDVGMMQRKSEKRWLFLLFVYLLHSFNHTLTPPAFPRSTRPLFRTLQTSHFPTFVPLGPPSPPTPPQFKLGPFPVFLPFCCSLPPSCPPHLSPSLPPHVPGLICLNFFAKPPSLLALLPRPPSSCESSKHQFPFLLAGSEPKRTNKQTDPKLILHQVTPIQFSIKCQQVPTNVLLPIS